MTAAAFDTLKAAEALAEAGIEEAHAKAIAETVRRATAADRNELATKADLEVDLAGLETRLTVRFVGIAVGIVLANAGATVAAVAALVNLLP